MVITVCGFGRLVKRSMTMYKLFGVLMTNRKFVNRHIFNFFLTDGIAGSCTMLLEQNKTNIEKGVTIFYVDVFKNFQFAPNSNVLKSLEICVSIFTSYSKRRLLNVVNFTN